MCLLWAMNFQGLTAGFACLPTLSQASTTGNTYNHMYQVFHSRRHLSLLATTRHKFSCSATVRLHWTSSNGTEPTYQPPSVVFDRNHALTPMKCNVSVHNAMRWAIACLCHATYVINSIWTTQIIHHHVSWTIIL